MANPVLPRSEATFPHIDRGKLLFLGSSVAESDPQDPYVFGSPESPSFYNQAKIVRKNLNSYCFLTTF
jgi:hypothetical protein